MTLKEELFFSKTKEEIPLKFINTGKKLLKMIKIQRQDNNYVWIRAQDENVYKVRKQDYDLGLLVLIAII